MISFGQPYQFRAISCVWREREESVMRLFLFMSVSLIAFASAVAHAQDIPGIEICTAEKAMERRTSCLQSNVDFLQKTITKLTLDHQQKLDAANRQIETLKASLVGLQKIVEDLRAARKPADAKSPEAKSSETKAPEIKTPDTKTPDK